MERTAPVRLRGLDAACIESLMLKEVGGRYRLIYDRSEIERLLQQHGNAHLQRGEFPNTFVSVRPAGLDTLTVKVKP
jgi:hypothetical protein